MSTARRISSGSRGSSGWRIWDSGELPCLATAVFSGGPDGRGSCGGACAGDRPGASERQSTARSIPSIASRIFGLEIATVIILNRVERPSILATVARPTGGTGGNCPPTVIVLPRRGLCQGREPGSMGGVESCLNSSIPAS